VWHLGFIASVQYDLGYEFQAEIYRPLASAGFGHCVWNLVSVQHHDASFDLFREFSSVSPVHWKDSLCGACSYRFAVCAIWDRVFNLGPKAQAASAVMRSSEPKFSLLIRLARPQLLVSLTGHVDPSTHFPGYRANQDPADL